MDKERIKELEDAMDWFDDVQYVLEWAEGHKKFVPIIMSCISLAIEAEKNPTPAIDEGTMVTPEGKIEVWCEFYKCSSCGDKNIEEGSNYCLNCGKKIKWLKEGGK